MPIYPQPVRQLMREMVDDLHVQRGEIVDREQVVTWFKERYPLACSRIEGVSLIEYELAVKLTPVPSSASRT